MLCIFGITHREKVCVVTVKCYNNLKDNMGMPFINVFLICIAILCLIVAFWYIEKLVDQKKDYVAMVYKLQKNVEGDNLYTEEMMLKDLSSFSKQITLWGSSKVVNLWVEFREKGKVQEQGNLFILEELMNEMRKDLGMKKVEKGNLLAFFVNDIKKYINK